MIEFHVSTPADKAWVDELLVRGNYWGYDYNFTNLYVWNQTYNQRITWMDDLLVTRVCGHLGCSHMYPAGSGDIATVIRTLGADVAKRGEPLCLVCLTPRQMAELEEFLPGRLVYTADRGGYDYLYEVERLARLGGEKLHAKRNHINCFVENNPTQAYEEITPATLPEYLGMDREWYRRPFQREGDAEERGLGDERIVLRTAMEHYEELGLEGGPIRVYGEAMAFIIGDRLSADIYDMRFEKAYGELRGACAMTGRGFVRQVQVCYPEIRYLNREGNMGVEGLRKAKQSYYPNLMVERHTAVMR